MTFERKTAWLVETNTDLTEGKGQTYPQHICFIEATAQRLAKKAYVMGTDAPVSPVTLILFENRWYGPVKIEPATSLDIERQALIDQRKAALAKAKEAGLSDEDIALISRGQS